MPLIEERFVSQLINIIQVDPDPDNGIEAGVDMVFAAGSPDGRPENSFYLKRTLLEPASAVSIGKALVEVGEALLAKPNLAVVRGMADADAEAQKQEALRAAHHPV